jgi:pyruvate,water dikinase
VIEARNLKQRKEMGERVEREVRSQRFGMPKWKLFSKILGFARRYIIFREDERFNRDGWITMNRRIYLEIGKGLRQKGILEVASEIFFLTKDEIRKLATNAYTEEESGRISFLVKDRKAEFLKYEHTTPPKFLQGSREFDDPPPTERASFQGIASSQGILTAPVRVLHRIEDIWQVSAGEILAVPRTDPGWTPVFSKIGGLITETGGILSHGAVVSREYGIPAVTNIFKACKIFRTGQIVTIDGSKGLVTLENQSGGNDGTGHS